MLMKIVKIALRCFVLLLIASFWFKDSLPSAEEILPSMQKAPVQTPTSLSPFSFEKEGKTYTVTPLYNYELHGLVVSYHNADSWLDYMHGAWGESLNVKDLCVVWGSNVDNELYDRLHFKSGDFTCYVSSYGSDPGAWEAFDLSGLSNNHLLSEKPALTKAIMQAQTGDQVRFTGYLSNYEHDEGFQRGTSTSRDDTGDRACETVYVSEFSILKKANQGWRTAFTISAWGIPAGLVLLFILTLGDIFYPKEPNPEEHYSRGVVLASRGKYKKAVKEFNLALKYDPEMGEAYGDRAMAWDALGEFARAEEDRGKAAFYSKRDFDGLV